MMKALIDVDLNQLRRVALLVASLDRDTADQLLEQLPDEQERIVRDTLLELVDVDAAEQSVVIREFLEEDGRALSFNVSAPPARPRSQPQQAQTDNGFPAAESSQTSTKPLSRASERLIAECLADEMPQAIAVALAQLPTQRASEVVSHLPAALQTEVLERLVEFDPSNSVDAPEIRNEFNHWLNEQIERSLHRAELAARLAAILDAAHSGTRTRILNNVSSSDARLAKELQHQLAVISATPE